MTKVSGSKKKKEFFLLWLSEMIINKMKLTLKKYFFKYLNIVFLVSFFYYYFDSNLELEVKCYRFKRRVIHI